jgi:hypothetical protein
MNRIRYYIPDAPIIREYTIDPQLKKVVEYVQYPVIRGVDPNNVVCARERDCHVVVKYDRRGYIKSFAMGSFTWFGVGQFVEYQEGIPIPASLFTVDSVLDEKSRFVVDPAISDSEELMIQVGIGHGSSTKEVKK